MNCHIAHHSSRPNKEPQRTTDCTSLPELTIRGSMSNHFSAFKEHRTYIQRLYRYTLRTLNERTYSHTYRKFLHERIRTSLNNNRNNKSSWSVREKILRLETLGSALHENNIECVEKLISQTQLDPDIVDIKRMIKEHEERIVPPQQDPQVLRSCNVVDRYIKIKQSQNLLPIQISKKIKRHLLTPVALDWDASNKISRIKTQLEKGVTKTYLTYTRAGPNIIWFIRSPLNRHKSQSKKLSYLISTTKKQCQDDLDTIDMCHENGKWAITEGVWEEYLKTGNLLNFESNPDLYRKINTASSRHRKENHNARRSVNEIPSTLFHWLEPLATIISDISKKQQAEAKYFNDYKDKMLIKEGQMQHYKDRTAIMHERRKARFATMMDNEIPNALTFDKGFNLTTILERNKF